MKQLDFEKTVQNFIDIEEKYDLFNLKEKDVYIWKIIRFYVFEKIILKVQGIQSIHLRNEKKNFFSMIFSSIFKNPFLKRKKELIVFDHPRKIKFNNQEIDPYTHYFLQGLSKEKYELIERRYVGSYNQSLNSTNSTYDVFSLLNKINKKFINVELSEEINNILLLVEKDVLEIYDLELDILQLTKDKLLNFISLKQVFSWYLKIKRPKKLYLVVSYNLEPIISAAQDNGLEVIEFQHGVMGPTHMGYHFPNVKEVPYFPNQLYMFGELWNKITLLPTSTQKTLYGYPYLKESILKFKSKIEDKDEKQIVIISQGTIGKSLSDICLKVAQDLSGYSVKYKLHPGEFGRWRNEYPALVEIEKLPNVEIIENERNLYDLFSRSKFVIGVNSTAIFEAIAFKVEPIIVKLPSYETMKYLNEHYNVPILVDSHQIKDYIINFNKNDKQLSVDVDSIFKGLY